MGWFGLEKRRERRLQNAELLYPFRFQISHENQKLDVELVNYHHRGACLKVPSTIPVENGKTLFLDLYLGKKLIHENLMALVVWETTKEDGLMGVKFASPVIGFIRRPERFLAHEHIAPWVSAKDPVIPNRDLYFKVINISSTGLLLQSSLANRHLMTGITIRNATLSLPGSNNVQIDMRIQRTEPSNVKDTFEIGTQFLELKPKCKESIAQYLSRLSPFQENRAAKLRESELLAKEVRRAITYHIVTEEEEYEKVLKLRFEGYKLAGKTKPGATWRDQGEGLKSEGTIITAYLGGELVASVELRFSDEGKPLRMEKILGREVLAGKVFEKVVELNKLVVLPHAQGTDIVLGMMQKMHAVGRSRGRYDVIMFAADNLVKFYSKTGCRKLGPRIPHPQLVDSYLHLMILPAETTYDAKKINPAIWATIFMETTEFMHSINLVELPHFNALDKIQMRVLPSIFLLTRRIQKLVRTTKNRKVFTQVPNDSPELEQKTGT